MKSIFSERLQDLREDKGLSIKQLAKELNFSDVAISRWERGLRIPNIEVLYKIALYFKVSADYLIGLED